MQRAPDVDPPPLAEDACAPSEEPPNLVRRAASRLCLHGHLRARANTHAPRPAARAVGSSLRDYASVYSASCDAPSFENASRIADQSASYSRSTEAGLPSSGARSVGECRPPTRFVKRVTRIVFLSLSCARNGASGLANPTRVPLTHAASALDKTLQPGERVVPFFRDQLKISVYLGEALLFQFPDALAPLARTPQETGVFHHAQVFGDRLARDGKPGPQLRNRPRAIGAEADDQTQPRLIAQRRKDRRRLHQLSRCPNTTRPGQDTSRSASSPSSSRPHSQ
jgi:hypothetical protein